ncbi:MAG: hypothetical protein V7745_05335 [Pseudomonadales bacterium]
MKEQPSQQPEETRLQRIKGKLLKRAENHRANLQLLIIGAAVFFVGAATIVWADHNMPVSLKQELVGLGGMVLLVGGGITALTGYLSLSLLRLLKFFNDDS